ncbi:glucosyltransferase [Clostridiales Family XIII bacterium PM5-7]
MSKELLSVIVPCYNEEEALPLFHQVITPILCGIEKTDYELIFVDDGSNDKTLEMIKKLVEKDFHCRYIGFSRNFGKEAGMYAGLAEAKGDYCVLMDADLQHPPTLLPEMLKAITEEGYDCCGGQRCGREGDGALRSFFSKTFYKISQRLTKIDMTDGHGDFRMMKRSVVEAILEMKEYNRYMKGLFAFVGFNTKWIKYDNVERACGNTKWSVKSLFSYAFEGILAFSTAPLKMAGLVGCLLLVAGCFVILFNMSSLNRVDVILAVVLIVSSLQMFFLYILGAYVSKDYLENKKRPVYIVKEKG